MNESIDPSVDDCTPSLPEFPDAVGTGATILVAGTVDPSTCALGLRALCQYGRTDESAFVVTTTESADRTSTVYDRLCPSGGPSIGLVDTTSESQYLASLYGGTPTVFTPSSADLERIVIGLSELSESMSPNPDSRHLIVRSLTPILDHSSTGRVSDVLQRIAGLRTGSGIGFYGLTYTEHDEETIAALAQHVDGILWVTGGVDTPLTFDYQSARRFSVPSSPGPSYR
ncbi:DUF7504 family protein [Halovivax cerinus]|uniref:RecA-superfamily ATPase possibly involved in signal transduction n=1 Tax=Halovivax cerinus TaxID=1487865 RepID=A0ABD5NQH1_9EURY|nr:hypothetical protein [Halovivax cerinus]